MTELEKRAIQALEHVHFPREGWYEKRFIYLKMRLAVMPNARLVETQQADLWLMVWKFRRQIDDAEVLARADQIVNGALQLAFHGETEG